MVSGHYKANLDRQTMTFPLFFPSPTPPLTHPFRTPIPTAPFLNLPIPTVSLSRTPSSSCRQHFPVLTAISSSSEPAQVEEKLEAQSPASSQEAAEDPTTVSGLEESVLLLKLAAKTRKVPGADVLGALSAIKKAKVDSSSFLETLGGSESPGKTWMLIFTGQGQLDKGSYFPVTAVQRFDAVAKRIENGVYLGPIGNLTFEGKFSWKKKILVFMFEYLRIKIGPFGPLQISLGNQHRELSTKDPFFIWFYIDDEIAVAQGRGGGVAFWCRCKRVP